MQGVFIKLATDVMVRYKLIVPYVIIHTLTLK
jgi:hypothetical protein